MTLHPITVVNQVIDEYRDYLRTEFRARDPKLRQALEDALDLPLFLAQDPFFQAHRPFKSGKAWRDLKLDARLAEVMEKRTGSKTCYLHQSRAIEHLLGESVSPMAVTTGTGSGKTECFLLPVIQNAIEDSAKHKKSGLTAILVYPMNALANDQHDRIKDYLESSGHTHVKVARYDRSTKQDERARLRKNPPHILLTNYMMLEYLLVRPADRVDLFKKHRCRFVVLDEVHTYRGGLGSNIALLFRRLVQHLKRAQQDRKAVDGEEANRFPDLVPVATSATIKSVDEAGKTAEEVRELRDQAVQEFLGKLTGYPDKSFKVLGEEMQEIRVPQEAGWAEAPVVAALPDFQDPASVRGAVARLAGLPEDTPVEQSARTARILWTLGELLAKKPLSVSQIVEAIKESVPERQSTPADVVRAEVESALVAGAAMPDGIPGALRLRTHRFVRGGWRFHRCISRDCGRLFAKGEEECASCGHKTAPLFICRSCGADAMRFAGTKEPEKDGLKPTGDLSIKPEWLLYDAKRHELFVEDIEDEAGRSGGRKKVKQMKGNPVLQGSFEPATCSFSEDKGIYPMGVALAPARNHCLVCGAMAGPASVLTPVALGTSAAVRVMAEGLTEGLAVQHKGMAKHDGKERLLIFADSRQDAAHQARFITYAGRYDRMRRRLVRILEEKGRTLSIAETVHELMRLGLERSDNHHLAKLKLKKVDYLSENVRNRAAAWEEAPLLDDLAVSAGYRATVLNLGLVGVRYDKLAPYVKDEGGEIATELGINTRQLLHLCRCVLEEFRLRRALSRPMMQFNPAGTHCPDEFKGAADWERRYKQPVGYPLADGEPVAHLKSEEVVEGVTLTNAWKRSKKGGTRPRLEHKFRQLLKRMGGNDPEEHHLVDLLSFLAMPGLLEPSKLFGYWKQSTLLQVNADSVRLELLRPEDRFRCSVCNVKMPWSRPGTPCPMCHGVMEHWPEIEVDDNRYVQRIRTSDILSLNAGEHTAQVTGDARIELEENFKGPPKLSPINVLSCSPTLEMGIDVGTLDAVVMRNVPPRPDNYAQRGGRAGRRSRVGIVLGYARSTPHDAYFFDRPEEMIAGEVPAPMINLGNRDVVVRHLNAIVLGLSEPGLAGRMVEYVTLQGDLVEEQVDEFIGALKDQFDEAQEVANKAWGKEILDAAGFPDEEDLKKELAKQPARIRDLFDRVRKQIIDLQTTVVQWAGEGMGSKWSAASARDLQMRLLGIASKEHWKEGEADDRSAGHPMRRFAEFGILPGYEFPSEPATLRLLHDKYEEEPIHVARRFGLAQYQPEAPVHARGHKWRVVGLDISSPWNPRMDEPTWIYTKCEKCELRYSVQHHVKCPRCGSSEALGKELPGYEFGGFVASRNDTPVLEEEDRIAMMSLLRCYPQWDGRMEARFELPTGWHAELRREEEVRWVNEWKPPTDADWKRDGRFILHKGARGFYLCPACGRLLTPPEPEKKTKKGKAAKKPKKGGGKDPFGHAQGCKLEGSPPTPLAITTKIPATTLRIIVDLPASMKEEEYQRWGYSLGYALRTGIRQLYMLEGPEVEVELEPAWEITGESGKWQRGALTFIDPAVGGAGFLQRAAKELDKVAKQAINHLDHKDCQTSCYRCLKSYRNQRFHQHLAWPEIIGDLRHLAAAAPAKLRVAPSQQGNPRPWLEAYEAGVGSPLELRFLRLFEKHGIEVEKQVAVSPDEGGKAISVADFVVKGKPIAIYVDGAAFHTGDRLRRDKYIRDKLREGSIGWKVVEVGIKDLHKSIKVLDVIQD